MYSRLYRLNQASPTKDLKRTEWMLFKWPGTHCCYNYSNKCLRNELIYTHEDFFISSYKTKVFWLVSLFWHLWAELFSLELIWVRLSDYSKTMQTQTYLGDKKMTITGIVLWFIWRNWEGWLTRGTSLTRPVHQVDEGQCCVCLSVLERSSPHFLFTHATGGMEKTLSPHMVFGRESVNPWSRPWRIRCAFGTRKKNKRCNLSRSVCV